MAQAGLHSIGSICLCAASVFGGLTDDDNVVLGPVMPI